VHHSKKLPQATVALDLDKAWGLYDRQARFANNNAPLSAFIAGVGAGKTHALICWTLIRAIKNEGCVGALFGRTMRDHERVLLRSLFNRLAEIKDACGQTLLADYSKGESKITLVNGSEIWALPFGQVDRLRGITLSFAGVDEVEFCQGANPEDVHTVLTGRMRGHGPTPGIAYCTSPNGYRGVVRLFVDAQRNYLECKKKGDTEGMAKWARFYTVTATSFNNPYNPDSYFQALKSMSAKRYQQEVLGHVLAPQNTVFSLQNEHFVPWRWQEHPNLPRVYGVDWGNGASANVGVMIQVTPSGLWVVADELVCDDAPRGKFMDLLTKWVKSHGAADPDYFGVDRAIPTENGMLVRAFRNSRVRWLESKEEQSVNRGVEMMRDMLEPQEGPPRLVFSTSLTQTHTGLSAPIVPAMRGLAYLLDADGNPTPRIRYNTPFSHATDALRYAQQAGAYDPQLHGGRRPWSDPIRPATL